MASLITQPLLDRLIHPKKSAPESTLLEVLRKLDIQPFDPVRVRDYKERKLQEAWDNMLLQKRCEGWTDRYARDDAFYLSSVMTQAGPRWTDNDRYALMRSVYSAYPHCFMLGWHLRAVEDVEIPNFVQRKMAQISSEIPGVSFAADVLESDTKPYDPFLVVRHEGEEYYVEVWGTEDRDFS